MDFETPRDREFPLILGEQKTSLQLLKVSPKIQPVAFNGGKKGLLRISIFGLRKARLSIQSIFSYFPHFFQDETISRNGSSRKKATGKDTMELETCTKNDHLQMIFPWS